MLLPPPPDESLATAPQRGWGVLRRHRRLIAVSTALGLLAGLALATRSRPVYEGHARLRLDQSPVSLAPQQAAPGPLDLARRVGTEMEVLRSRALAEAVVDSLGLRVRLPDLPASSRGRLLASVRLTPGDSARLRFVRGEDRRFRVRDALTERDLGDFGPGEPIRLPGGGTLSLARAAQQHREFVVEISTRDQVADALLRTVEVAQPRPDAEIISVSYRGDDPALAGQVPNALVARYMELRREMRSREARSTARFMRRQLDTIRVQLAAAEDRLQRFREAEGVIDLPVEASTQVSRLSQMEAERSVLAAEQASLAALLAEARSQGGRGGASPYRKLVAFPSLMRNDVASELLASLAQVEDERAKLLVRRRPTDPEVAPYNRRIAELEDQIQGMVTTYQRGLAGQVAAMDATLGGFERRLERVPAKEVQFDRLARQTKSLEETYGLLQSRLKEAEIAQAAAENPGVTVIEAARAPSAPTGGAWPMLLALGTTLGGLGVGVALGFLREYRDPSVRGRADLEAATALPVLGWIPRLESAAPRRAALRAGRGLLAPAGAEAAAGAGAASSVVQSWVPELPADWELPQSSGDAMEWLYRNVLFSRAGTGVKTVLFTSPLPGDGKTSTAAGLAVTLARRGIKVLLVDADLRRGAASALFRDARTPGLSELLAGRAPIQTVLRSVRVGEGELLHYLPSGGLPHDPIRLVDSARMRALLEWLEPRYDLVVLDSPPVNLFADAAVLGGYADAVLLVARAGVTPFEALVHAAEQCRRARVPCVGTVLNAVAPEHDDGSVHDWHEYGRAYYSRAGAG